MGSAKFGIGSVKCVLRKRGSPMTLARFSASAALLLCFASVAHGGELAILPAEITLSGPNARQSLLLERVEGGQFIGEAPAAAIEWAVSDPKIARVDDGVLEPLANGEVTLTAKSGEQTASAKVRAVKFDQSDDVSFRNLVQSVLTKAGCNSGACHGAAAGKNGFKLSLRGYDADADFFTITRQAGGRRLVPEDPARSLLLLKPTAAIPHKGGVRFDVGSPEYNALARWIAEGGSRQMRTTRASVGWKSCRRNCCSSLARSTDCSFGRISPTGTWKP